MILEVADPNNSSTILHALKRHHDRLDVERGEGDVQCYVDFPGDPDAVALDAVHFLNEKGLAHLIALPPRIEWWDESAYHYVAPAQPLVDVAPLTDVRWRITVWPTDFFDWRRARAELDRRQRPPLRETRRKLEIPAEDEADALRLASDCSVATQPEASLSRGGGSRIRKARSALTERRTPRRQRQRRTRTQRHTIGTGGASRRHTEGTRGRPRSRTPRTSAAPRRTAGRRQPSRRVPCGAPPGASQMPYPRAPLMLDGANSSWRSRASPERSPAGDPYARTVKEGAHGGTMGSPVTVTVAVSWRLRREPSPSAP